MEEKLKYITVNEFLKSNKLKRSDIMLSRGKKSLLSKLIMRGTKSNWSHAGLVFAIPKSTTGYDNTFIIESIGDGVDITNLSHYLIDHSKKYDVGIRRLESDWFSNNKDGLIIRKKVRGNMLNSIKAEYDFGAIFQIGIMILKKLIFGIQTRISGFEKVVGKKLAKGKSIPSQFICSGFVQYGFYDTIAQMIGENKLNEKKLNEVIFNPRFSNSSDKNLLLSTTPEDIATTDKLKWKYLIRNGKVYEISSNDDVAMILKQK